MRPQNADRGVDIRPAGKLIHPGLIAPNVVHAALVIKI